MLFRSETLEVEDFETIRRMIRDHFRLTGSKKALDILNNWQTDKKLFKKVMPRDYKAVMEKKKQLQMV